MFENNLIHNILIYSRWLRPVGKKYIRVHDGKACMTSSVCRQTVQGMDYTFNLKGSLGEAHSRLADVRYYNLLMLLFPR